MFKSSVRYVSCRTSSEQVGLLPIARDFDKPVVRQSSATSQNRQRRKYGQLRAFWFQLCTRSILKASHKTKATSCASRLNQKESTNM